MGGDLAETHRLSALTMDYTGDYWSPRCEQHPERGCLWVSVYKLLDGRSYTVVCHCVCYVPTGRPYQGHYWEREHSTLEMEVLIATGALIRQEEENDHPD